MDLSKYDIDKLYSLQKQISQELMKRSKKYKAQKISDETIKLINKYSSIAKLVIEENGTRKYEFSIDELLNRSPEDANSKNEAKEQLLKTIDPPIYRIDIDGERIINDRALTTFDIIQKASQLPYHSVDGHYFKEIKEKQNRKGVLEYVTVWSF